ncbi:hypothetical protein MFIFM68171_02266 [Madurella fahalii]|uniref:BTB domain-containing protein n=1 Tax=Madurella fahalii TaxID=1157608 RepID=A0ABQ0G2U1_9PEZI
MKPKKNLKGGEDGLMDSDKDEDAYFDKSPFSSAPMIHLQFKRGDHLSVHRAVLQRNPKLALLDTSHHNLFGGGASSQSHSLKHISRSAGHVLIHYLYTDTYHTLKWMGPKTGREETIAKLKTAFEVYATARKYELDGLEELAKEQISILSKGVDAFTIVDVVNEAYPSSTDKDAWFPTYMKAVVKTAFENSAALLNPEVHVPPENKVEDDAPTAKTLLRSALEVYREMVKDTSVTIEPPQQEDDGWERCATTKKNQKDMESIFAAAEEPYAEEPAELAESAPDPVEPVEEILLSAESAPDPMEPVEETLVPAETAPDPVDNFWGAINSKGKKNKKKGKKGAAAKEHNVNEQLAKPEPIPEAGEQDGTTAGNTAGGGPFPFSSVGSTTRTAFGATNKAAVCDPPSTASVAFTPATEKEAYNPSQINSFQNILFMDAYKRWSSEELRLADYNQGRKQVSAGGTGAFGAFSFRRVGLGVNTRTNIT